MSVRLYWSPVIGDGLSVETSYRPGIAEYPVEARRSILSGQPRYLASGDPNPDAGKPRHSHALCLIRATDWSAIEADASQVLLLPESQGMTPREVLTWLSSRTVANLSTTYRNRWIAALTAVGADIGDITGGTTILKVLRRLLVALDPCGASELGFFA